MSSNVIFKIRVLEYFMMMILANCLYLISRIRRRIFGGEGDGVDFLIEFFLKGFGLFLSYV